MAQDHARARPRASFIEDFPELDCLRNLIPADMLAAAASRAGALHVGADRVLIAQGVIGESAYLHRLSMRSGIPLVDFAAVTRADTDLTDDKARLAAQSGMLWMQIGGKTLLVVCLRDDRARYLVRMAAASPREIGHLRLTSEKALQDFLLYRTSGIIDPAIELLHDRYPALSAAPDHRHSGLKVLLRRMGIGSLLIAALTAGLAFPIVFGNLLALIFLAGIALRLLASLLAIDPPIVRHLADSRLPDYSIVVALYHEAPSIPQLLAALTALAYPREKLDIILVVETDDLATRAAIAREHPPSCVRVIVAPNEGPRTKPKALNVALPFARGAFVAVYDAEDRPDPDQLRIALAAFHAGGDDLVCVQARLAIENSGDSVLTGGIMAQTPQENLQAVPKLAA